MARREFPRKVRAAAIKRADGHCERCKAVLKTGEGEVDHILEDALGGEPVLANAQVLCRPCHKEKTADRVRKIRKADRARDKATGAIRPVVKIPTRPGPISERTARNKERERLPELPRRNLYTKEERP